MRQVSTLPVKNINSRSRSIAENQMLLISILKDKGGCKNISDDRRILGDQGDIFKISSNLLAIFF
jgi:hypothetical protein